MAVILYYSRKTDLVLLLVREGGPKEVRGYRKDFLRLELFRPRPLYKLNSMGILFRVVCFGVLHTYTVLSDVQKCAQGSCWFDLIAPSASLSTASLIFPVLPRSFSLISFHLKPKPLMPALAGGWFHTSTLSSSMYSDM